VPVAVALLAPFACAASGPVINVNTKTKIAIAAGFSGFNTPQLRNGVEYFDPKFLAAVTPLKPGWVRFPAGTASIAFDWNAGHINTAWMKSLITGNPPPVDSGTATILTTSQMLTQAKGGLWLADFATFAQTLGAHTVVCVNGYTDTNPSSTELLARAALRDGLNPMEWELANEPYLYPLIFPTAPSYASAMNNPYYNDLISAASTATAGLFYAGLFPGQTINSSAWDSGVSTYTPTYWNGVSVHIYPIQTVRTNIAAMETLNGILAHGSTDYINSYLLPLIGPHTPVFITELNCCTPTGFAFLGSLYNGIFLAEYIMRMSTVPNVKAVGINSLYTDNYDYHGLVQSVNDFESYLEAQVAANPNYSTNTATDPNTQFQFYTSAPGLAMQVANQAINNSTHIWPTTVTGGPTVPILGYDGNPIPALYAQGYAGNNSTHYLLITNKAGQAKAALLQVNGVKLTSPLTVTSVSSSSAIAANNAASPDNVQIQTTTSANPLTLGPYSVNCVTW